MKIGLPIKSGDIIKIEGKNFESLSMQELVLMIEADSSISPDGNEYFSSCALDEFLHGADIKRPDLGELKKEILANIYTMDRNKKE